MPHQDGVLTIFDTLICMFIVFPLSILHWSGTWMIQEVYLMPEDHAMSSWISLAIGANVCLIELLLQPSLANLLLPYGPCIYIPVSRLHLYIHGWAVMCYWRGLWNLLDIYMGRGWLNAVVTYITCTLIMILARTVRTPVGVPVAIQVDTDPHLLDPDTVFKIPPSRICAFVLDCCFTQFIIVSSSICIWRAIWNILDAFVFPLRHEYSDIISLFAGFCGVTLAFLLRYPTSHLSRMLDTRPWAKLVFEDFVFLVLTWFNLLLWRGSWNLCEHHFIPNERIGSWVSHALGTVGLMAVQAFNNVGLHGIVRDGSFSDGEGIYVTKYLSLLIEADCSPTASSDDSQYEPVTVQFYEKIKRPSCDSNTRWPSCDMNMQRSSCDMKTADDIPSALEETIELLGSNTLPK